MSLVHSVGIVGVIFCTNFVFCIMVNHRSRSEKEVGNDTGSRIVFPESPEDEVQEIPLDLIRKLDHVSSMEDFLNNMVDNAEPVGISVRMGSDDVERSSLRTPKMAKCMPELTTVSLKPEKTSSYFYYPPCTRVTRCGGCCHHDLFACRPVEKEIIPMTVAVTEYLGGQRFHLKEKVIVEVEQHTKCECGCKIQPEDCTKFQKYAPEKCKCECTNVDKERKCYKEAPKKIWDPDKCVCECREEIECGSGFEFDAFSCSCIPSRGRRKPSFIYEIE